MAWCEINAVTSAGKDARTLTLKRGDLILVMSDGRGLWIEALTRFGRVELHTYEVSSLSRNA